MLHAAIARYRRDQSGATAIEYGLIAGLLAIAVLGGLALVGANVETLYAESTGTAASAIAEANTRLR